MTLIMRLTCQAARHPGVKPPRLADIAPIGKITRRAPLNGAPMSVGIPLTSRTARLEATSRPGIEQVGFDEQGRSFRDGDLTYVFTCKYDQFTAVREVGGESKYRPRRYDGDPCGEPCGRAWPYRSDLLVTAWLTLEAAGRDGVVRIPVDLLATLVRRTRA